MNELLYQIWLSGLKRVSNTVMAKLHDRFGSFEAIYHLESIDLSEDDTLSLELKNSLAGKNLDNAREILERCEVLGAKILSYYDPDYPERLKQIPDAPMQLYVMGTLPNVDERMSVAVVGARRPSIYGTNTAQNIAYELANAGMLIVSGMARGIDSAAHRGALRAEADTIAVLGCGVDVVYPPENGELKKMIEGNGAVISEFPPGTPPHASNFPARNRIISGLSCATVIVEGKATSGSTITARMALDQGREVFCVPGNIDNPLSVGPNTIVRDGGRLITCAKDIILDLTADYPELMVETVFSEEAVQKHTDRKLEKLPEEQRRIAAVLSRNHPVHVDEICFKTGIEVAVVNQSLFMLELNGLVKQLPGKNYILSE